MASTIEIDFDVHKLIENERRAFNDPPLAALRRLLKLPPAPATSPNQPQDGRPWVYKGELLEHGTLLRMRYNRRQHDGRIADGRWFVGGELYDTPSGAAAGVARTKDGKATNLNGWDYWEVKRPGRDQWLPINLIWPEH